MMTIPGPGKRHIPTTPTILFAPMIRSKIELQTVLCTRSGAGGVMEPAVPLHNCNMCNLPVAAS